ncbi:dihydrolipoamide dehydrogenase [Buchnera aphidicola (Schlechtendalia chinensis)]|uniref:Dihydrolipoyl dehydrogenase n=1 Tax=Buchnera aphidicola subsp. Schlechtendalia chinensis TaxID=118110 RepID=A0A172WDE5_BUCSC|nr:dihydrolipoyl dehydrogenase [Buchnera aphidicola]ANF16994.1 dihydrolipoamide dehydrogenase [Buchnera aphidicola (Schlechtendalia chinensis)]
MTYKKMQTQVVVIGSGPAGYSSAFRCADLGLSTVLVERYENLGGVCLNVGCIPSKSLLHISKVVKDAKSLSDTGVQFLEPIVNLEKVREWKNKIINNLNIGIKSMAEKRNIKIIVGTAKFLSVNSIFVEGNKESVILDFENIVLAVGSSPKRLSYVPSNDPRVWDSTSALSISNIPEKLLVIGSGIIGLEMATFYSSFGAKVDVLDNSMYLLPHLDRDIVDSFYKIASKSFNIFLNSEISKIESNKVGFLVSKIVNQNIKEVKLYNAILVSVGRVPNLDSLEIEKVGLNVNSHGFLEVDDQLRTGIPNIYAIGDITGQPMLAHKGIHQGRIAAEIISGKNHYFNPYAIPCILYTDPEVAWIGITEQEAIKKDIKYESAVFPWNALGKAISSNCSNGMTKLIFDSNTKKIIGGSVIGSNAGELLGEIGLAIEMGCDAEDIELTIHAHPTLYESIGLSAQIFQGTVTDLINSKK